MKRLKSYFSIVNPIAIITLVASAYNVHALDIYGRSASEGGSGTKSGIVALYLFNNVSGNRVPDVSGVSPALDLTIDDTNKIRPGYQLIPDPSGARQAHYLDFIQASAVRSAVGAGKISSQCKSSNELTVEAWIQNDRDDEILFADARSPLKIINLSSSSANSSFYIGQHYDGNTKFRAGIRTGNRIDRASGEVLDDSNNAVLTTNDDKTANRIIFHKDLIQHVVFTQNQNGEAKLYVSEAGTSPNGLIPVLRETGAGDGFLGNFSGWGNDHVFTLGNEPSYNTPGLPKIASNTQLTTEDRGWRGRIYMVAIYCRALSSQEILGDAAPDSSRFRAVKPDPNAAITENHKKAALLYKRIVGVTTPIDDPLIAQMADYISQGQWLMAAEIALQQDAFLNITVRDFAKRMSTRDESANVSLNDFVTTIIGVTRDQLSAKQLLTGNFLYRADPTKAAVPNNMIRDILTSNNHYEALEKGGYNLAKVLRRYDGQKLYNGSGGVTSHRDPAGVLTSRAFMAAHAIAGTNRRLVEYSFREFLCAPIDKWADASGPDDWIGRDVDRFPGGDHKKFLSSCRACHSNMDGFRGAFAKVSFENNFVKHAEVIAATSDPDNDLSNRMHQDPVGIAGKMNRNADTFPTGHATTTDAWLNYANRGLNASFFGWKAPLSGSGMRSFGEMVSNSDAFPKCMTKRAFRAVCKRDPQEFDQEMINRVANEFKNDNFNLKLLFGRVAVTPECIGN